MIYKALYKSCNISSKDIRSSYIFKDYESDIYYLLKSNARIEFLQYDIAYIIEVRFPNKKENNMQVVDQLLDMDLVHDYKSDLINIVILTEEEIMPLLLGD